MRMRSLRRQAHLPFLVTALATGATRAQCSNPWLAIPGANNTVEATATWDPDGSGPLPPHLVIGGAFTAVGGVAAAHVAAWNPTTGTWSPFGSGTDGTVADLFVGANGDLLAVGTFMSAGGTPCNGIARWHAGAWQPVGAGVGGVPRRVVETDQGEVVVTGLFTGASAVQNVASFTNGAWQYTSTDVNPGAPALTKLADGRVILSGNAGLWQWSPSGLQSHAPLSAPTSALCALRDGGLVAAGQWFQAGAATGHIARWDGATWQPLGNGIDLTFVGGINTIVELPDGDLVVGGLFASASGVPCANLARWDGVAWTPFGTGTDAIVNDATFLPQGLLAVGGFFATAGGAAASRLALLGTTCSGTAAAAGAGCASSGGSNLLTAVGVPWLGGPFTTEGSGLPPTSLALVVHGLQALTPGLPLSQALPPSPAGCDLHVLPALVDVALPANGLARATLQIPDAPSALGLTLFQQWVPLEFAAGGQLLATTATNALQLTVGSF